MCAHPEGTHEHVPLAPGEDPPTTCFADCDCEPVVFVRADLHRGTARDRDAAVAARDHYFERYRALRNSLRDVVADHDGLGGQ